MFKRTVPLLLLAALVLPAAAAAETSELEGPATVKGRGALQADVTMADPAGTRPVVFGGQGGLVRIVDLAGDLRVAGRCRAARPDREGRRSFVCNARAGRIRAHGSHFRFAARMRTWGLRLPAGAAATLRGSYVVVAERGEDASREQPKREAPRSERPTARG